MGKYFYYDSSKIPHDCRSEAPREIGEPIQESCSIPWVRSIQWTYFELLPQAEFRLRTTRAVVYIHIRMAETELLIDVYFWIVHILRIVGNRHLYSDQDNPCQNIQMGDAHVWDEREFTKEIPTIRSCIPIIRKIWKICHNLWLCLSFDVYDLFR